MRPGGKFDTPHIHPQQEERFTVFAGTLRFVIDGQEHILAAGQSVVVPPATPHTYGNVGSDEAHYVSEVRPALATEQFFEAYFGLTQDKKVDPKTGLPNLLQTAVVMHHFRREVALVSPPVWAQRLVFGLLAPLGRLLGYRAQYPYPRTGQATANLP